MFLCCRCVERSCEGKQHTESQRWHFYLAPEQCFPRSVSLEIGNSRLTNCFFILGGGAKQTRKSPSWAPPYHPASGSNPLRAPCCTLLPAATFLMSPDLERDRVSEKTICSPSFLITESPLGLRAGSFAHPKGLRISENL